MFSEFSYLRFLNFGWVARIDRLNIMFFREHFSENLEISDIIISLIFILFIFYLRGEGLFLSPCFHVSLVFSTPVTTLIRWVSVLSLSDLKQ